MAEQNKKKVAVVTGASRGIGRAIALELASRGATVVINYNGSLERAEEVQKEIEEKGGEAEIRQWNVADHKACESAVKDIVKTHGSIDILVNNAGITKDGLLMGMSEADFDSVIDVNLKGTFNMMRFVSRQMLRQRSGRIISMASVVGIAGNAGQANYAASKAGIIGMTKSAARELASRGITVNAVAPGFIETEMTAVLSEEVKKASAAQIPLGHFGKPEDIAKTVAFLASDDRFLLKRLCDRGFDRCRKFRRICDLGDRSAAGTICRFDDHREMLRFHALAFSDACKIRNRDPGFLESAPHGIFVGRLPDTFTAVSRKSQFLCQILYRDIRKI